MLTVGIANTLDANCYTHMRWRLGGECVVRAENKQCPFSITFLANMSRLVPDVRCRLFCSRFLCGWFWIGICSAISADNLRYIVHVH